MACEHRRRYGKFVFLPVLFCSVPRTGMGVFLQSRYPPAGGMIGPGCDNGLAGYASLKRACSGTPSSSRIMTNPSWQGRKSRIQYFVVKLTFLLRRAKLNSGCVVVVVSRLAAKGQEQELSLVFLASATGIHHLRLTSATSLRSPHLAPFSFFCSAAHKSRNVGESRSGLSSVMQGPEPN